MTFQSYMAFMSTTLAGISIDRLQTLCAVVEAGTIVAAAGPDPNRQSQFSRQIKQLEKAIGTPLFDRIGKNLKPNQAGRRVALASQTFFGALDDVLSTANDRAETVRLGAGESVLRWFVMPHLSELMSGDPPLRFDVRSLSTELALHEMLAGSVDLVIMRTDSVSANLHSEVIKNLKYVLAVPRALLRSREGTEVFEGKPLPFAELTGDGVFTRCVRATATTLGLNLRPVLQAQTFSLLISAVESGLAAAFLPEIAAKTLPEERFALVAAEGMSSLNRSLSLVWNDEVAESRNSVRRAIPRLRRALSTPK
jgi:DNA-binding transcriptional LysR family regulator